MKKIILSLMLLAANFYVNAQCVPGTISLPQAGYIIPDSATNFVTGCAGMPYDQVVYIKAPADTTFGGLPATVDSFVVDVAIGGLPGFLAVTTVPAITPASPGNPKTNFPRMIIKGDSLACIRISGNIPVGTSGNNPLTIGVRAYVRVTNIIPVDTLANVTYYHINIMNPCWAAGVSDVAGNDFKIINAIPNPANTTTQVAFQSNNTGTYQYKLVNSLGEIILSNSVKANSGLNYVTIDVSRLSKGLYMFSLGNGKNLLSQKIMVNK